MAKQPPPAEVLIAYLAKSHLPTVLIEGETDGTVFRKIQKRLGLKHITFLPCGSRSQVLEIFSERNQFESKQVAFFADRDLWYFTGIPSDLLP